MRRCLDLTIVLATLVSLWPVTAGAAVKKVPAAVAQTYTVMVGWENPREGIGINAYFPETATIHVGDTVHWVQNSNEIHTVTFLAGSTAAALIVQAADVGLPAGPSPLVFNPAAVNPAGPSNGQYDGSVYANSGLMGREAGQVQEFNLTFTKPGTYEYMCLVHGSMMSGHVVVVAADAHVSSPWQVMTQGRYEMAKKQAHIPAVLRAAQSQIKPAVKNADGTMTHTVMIGHSDGQIDLMKFFPDTLKVGIGDTVVWEMSPSNMAPHTVTFLNGEPEPELVIPVPQGSGPPVLYANPTVFFPSQPGSSLTRTGIYSSGVMNPVPGTTYTLVISNVTLGLEPYLCLLHDTSGMRGSLVIFSQSAGRPHPPVWPWPWPREMNPHP